MTKYELQFREATINDLDTLDAIRLAAFSPVFQSFRSILGQHIYSVAQAHEDEAQANLLNSMLLSDSDWSVFVVELTHAIVGFVSVRLDADRRIGEIGLNAVSPAHAGQGIGTRMYKFALNEMKNAGMKIATVGTGGDSSHKPALAAYRKAGFNVEIPSVWLCAEL